MLSGIPENARNYAWITAISVIAVLVVLAAIFWGILVYTGQQIPRELVLIVSGLGTIITQVTLMFVGRQARDNNKAAVETQENLNNGVLKETAEVRFLMKESAKNVAYFSQRLDLVQGNQTQILDRLKLINDRLNELQEREAS